MKQENKRKILKSSIIIILLIIIFLIVYLPLKLTGTLDKINSAEELKNVINSFGAYGIIMFFIIQFLQVVILPIPAMITTIAGTLIYGPWIASLISFFAVFLGSLFAFFLGKKFGKKLIVWITGEDTYKKWSEKLTKGKYVFFLMMLFPIFPDDILCLIVGATTKMSYKFFIITNLITRPLAILPTCFLGSGNLIPFKGWGIPVWIILILIIITTLFLSFKYQDKIENFITKLNNNKLNNNKSKSKNNKLNIDENNEINKK